MKSKTGIVALIILTLSLSSLIYSEEEKGVVFPGQSITLLGIQIKWIVPNKGKADPENLGSLEIIGPTQTISIPFKGIIAGEKVDQFTSCLYIDEVVLRIVTNAKSEKKDNPAGFQELYFKPVRVTIYATSQGSVPEIKNKPYNFNMYVSSLCPISLDKWKISLSEDRMELADGSQYYMIHAENREITEKIDITVIPRSFKKAGRFDIEVLEIVDELTKTLRFAIHVEPDMTIRGRDAYIDEFIFTTIDPANLAGSTDTRTLQYFLETLAEKYGFEIRWDEYPAHPESIDFLKSLDSGIKGSIRINKCNVGEYIDQNLNNKGIDFEWITPTTIRLLYKDYEKVLKDQEEEKKQEELLKAKKEEFYRDYAIETKAYIFNNISAETAKALISPELDVYILVKRLKMEQYYPEDSNIQKPEKFMIKKGASIRDGFSVLEKVQETAVADEKTNTLILSAIPITHEKFQEMIQKIDAILKKSESPISMKPFKISLSLFQGTNTASLDENARTQKKQEFLKQAEQYGINKNDIALLDFDILEPIGKGFTLLYPEKGEIGKTMVSLGKGLSSTLEFLDLRQPYLIVRASLDLRDENSDAALFESTLYLVPEKPTTLGVTDLKGAYIMVIKMEKPE